MGREFVSGHPKFTSSSFRFHIGPGDYAMCLNRVKPLQLSILCKVTYILLFRLSCVTHE